MRIISTDHLPWRFVAWFIYTALGGLLFMLLSALGVGDAYAGYAALVLSSWMGAFNFREPRLGYLD